MYPKLSLIIPVYNSELFIEDSINKLVKWSKEQNYSIELIIVNDGSTDNSKKQLEFINKENKVFKLISYPWNKGKGYAIKQGMHAAKGDFKVFTDAINQLAPKKSEIYKELKKKYLFEGNISKKILDFINSI